MSDDDFIVAAHQVVLGSDPNHEAMTAHQNYLRRIGGRMFVLTELAKTQVGRKNAPQLRGYRKAKLRYDLLKMPVVGWLLSLLGVRNIGERTVDRLAVQALRSEEIIRRLGYMQFTVDNMRREMAGLKTGVITGSMPSPRLGVRAREIQQQLNVLLNG
ncbi:hypothetical protein [Sphingobium nicotianae]|uniref:Uncharacterized protein n=1 Tax=Sphingobium nicotianae TaxID=2782607 RepID=A0A9X1IRJ9_9SPHN|nr:hypothetical protein [Sphingobium nicotianae]MBT2187513.1 hypothetical protein [Sphingobium nicotianae]